MNVLRRAAKRLRQIVEQANAESESVVPCPSSLPSRPASSRRETAVSAFLEAFLPVRMERTEVVENLESTGWAQDEFVERMDNLRKEIRTLDKMADGASKVAARTMAQSFPERKDHLRSGDPPDPDSWPSRHGEEYSSSEQEMIHAGGAAKDPRTSSAAVFF